MTEMSYPDKTLSTDLGGFPILERPMIGLTRRPERDSRDMTSFLIGLLFPNMKESRYTVR
jgi:hypothetical protein